jgi:hypothetical protein
VRYKRREFMKGGVKSVLHIVVWNGIVTHVYKLNENPDKPGIRLEEEFDYKVEYNESGVEPKIVRLEKGKDGWIISILKKEA